MEESSYLNQNIFIFYILCNTAYNKTGSWAEGFVT